jgi:hypothetical protein
MWSSLPKNLKTVLALAILGAVGVAAAAFRLSFIALREVASDPGLKFGKGNAWLLPIVLDAALVVSEVILLGASMVRVRNQRGELEPYDRTVPFVLVGIFGGATIYFNVTRVPAELRAVTVIPPAASILMTLALAYLMKMLARVSGADHIFEAPAELDPRQIVRSADVLQGEIVRGPDLPGQTSANWQMPRSQHLQDGQAGQVELERMEGPAKAELARRVCRAKSPQALAATTASSLMVELKAMGVDLSRQWAGKALADVQAEKNGKS